MAPIAMAVGLSLLYPQIVLDAVIAATILGVAFSQLTPATEHVAALVNIQIATLVTVDAAIIFFA